MKPNIQRQQKCLFVLSCKKLFLAIFALSSINANAGSKETESIFDLSLEELLKLKISVSTKNPENYVTTPGNVTIYSQKEIARTGYQNLSELAAITAGYSTVRSFGEKGFETRGQSAGAFENNKHLLLINGIPVNHARSYKVPVDREMPIFFAENIEFLKGPASALYGVSTFNGVINITQQSLTENSSRSSMSIQKGSLDNLQGFQYLNLQKGNDFASHLSFSLYQKDASRQFVGSVPNDKHLFWDDQNSVFINGNYDFLNGPLNGVTLGLIYQTRESGLGEYWFDFSSQLSSIKWSSSIPYIKYERELAERIKLSSYVKFNQSREQGFVPNNDQGSLNDTLPTTVFSAWDINVENTEVMAEVNWRYDDAQQFIFGVNYDTRHQVGAQKGFNGAFVIVDPLTNQFDVLFDNGQGVLGAINQEGNSDSIITQSIYAQYQFHFQDLKGLNFTLGFRQDNSSNQNNQFSQLSPRVGIVYSWNEHWSSKLLWGNALRSPGLKELGLNSDAKFELSRLNLDPSIVDNVGPETIESMELINVFQKDGLLLNVSLYKNKTQDSLQNIFTTIVDTEGQSFSFNSFINRSERVSSHGLEVEFKYQPNSQWWLSGNYSKVSSKKQNGQALSDIPRDRVNLLLGTQWTNVFSSNLIAKYIGSYQTADQQLFSGSTFVSFNSFYQVQKNLKLGIQIDNLLDKSYLYPRQDIATIPAEKRNIVLTAQINF